MARKNVKSEAPKKKRPISLNILEIAKRLQKIEEIISTPYTLPTASADTKGGVKVGNGLTMTGEVLSADAVDASDVSYSTGTVEDALDKLTSGTLGTGVVLTSGVDYVCPADGYIIIIVPNNAETIIGLNNNRVFDVKNVSGTSNYYCVFAKKGMTVYSNFSTGDVNFYPLA